MLLDSPGLAGSPLESSTPARSDSDEDDEVDGGDSGTSNLLRAPVLLMVMSGHILPQDRDRLAKYPPSCNGCAFLLFFFLLPPIIIKPLDFRGVHGKPNPVPWTGADRGWLAGLARHRLCPGLVVAHGGWQFSGQMMPSLLLLLLLLLLP